MAGFIPEDGDLLEVRVVCNTVNQIAENVLHYRKVSSIGGGLSLQELAFSLGARFAPLYRALMPIQGTFRGVSVQNLMTPKTVPYVSTDSLGAGTGGVMLAPTQTSYLISIHSAQAGHRGRGRIYPGFPPAEYIGPTGAMSNAGIIELANLADTIGPSFGLEGALASTTVALVIRNPDAIVAGARIPQWTTAQKQIAIRTWATQRRRGEHGARNIPPF